MPLASRVRLPSLALGYLPTVALLGCGTPEWQPSPVGEPLLVADSAPASRFADDLVVLGDAGDAGLSGPPLADAMGEPRVFFLWYADGGAPPTKGICKGAPPKFNCFGGGGEGCKKKVQAYLDKFYADFNLVFTTTQPAAGIYYTEVIASGSLPAIRRARRCA